MSKTPPKTTKPVAKSLAKAAAKAMAPKTTPTDAAPSFMAQGNRMWARRLLVILLAVFAVIMCVTIAMVWFARNTNTGMLTDNAYENGLNDNKTLAEQVREAGLGWSVVRNVADFPVRLVYALSDSKGVPLGGAWVQVKASSSEDGVAPFKMDLTEFTDGTYAADMTWPQKGQWILETTIVYGGKSLTAHERVTIE